MNVIDGSDDSSRQAQTMVSLQEKGAKAPVLYRHYWPPVPQTEGMAETLARLLGMAPDDQFHMLAGLRRDHERHGRFLHETLAQIYAHYLGYRDGVATEITDDQIEIALNSVKIRLEREVIDNWIGPQSFPEFASQQLAADYLDELAEVNPGVRHPLFEYLADEASVEQVEEFLFGETIRNEVVDDEVAMLVVGKQGLQKAVTAANLWDECGRGRLENFHTYWLRQLIEASRPGWTGFYQYRQRQPWFAKITSNIFTMLLTRPAFSQDAYGCFLIFESWVEPHFRCLLRAMDRLGIDNQDTRIYFSAHVAVDPRHSRELADGIRHQQPELSQRQVSHLVRGANIAAECGRRQYSYWLDYFTG